MITILQGDAVGVMRTLDSESVHCCITSPPYYKQRRYLQKEHPLFHLEIGQEKTPADYIQKLVAVFHEVHRVLKNDGTFWVVIDDKIIKGQPAGLPWRFVFAMREAGWFFVEDIVWYKPNPTPQSVRKKTTHAHEFVFHFSKSKHYYHDREAIRTPYAPSTIPRQMRGVSNHHKNINGAPGQSPHSMSRPRLNVREIYNGEATKDYIPNGAQNPSDTKRRVLESLMKYSGANKKSVWVVPKLSFRGAHFATFPPTLILPCVLAGCPEGGTVLDPFGGSGTVGEVCVKNKRSAILIDLNPDYAPMMENRCELASPEKEGG